MSAHELGCCSCGKTLEIDPYKYKPDVMPLEVCITCATKPGVMGVQGYGNNYLMYTSNDLENYWICNTSLH